MAFVTGTANSVTDLLSAIQNACVANGWTLSGGVLHKGTCYASIVVQSGKLVVTSGTGIDGSNALTGVADELGCVLGITNATALFAYPVVYFIHVLTAPDEVYVVVGYAAAFYQLLAFGQSASLGLNGTGNWYSGSQNTNNINSSRANTQFQTQGVFAENCAVMGMFYGVQYFNLRQNGGVDHELDSVTWKVEGAWRDWAPQIMLQPNGTTGETVLIPIRVYAPRPSGFISPVLECGHARFCRMDNLEPEQIITLGSDKWKIYPWWTKLASQAISPCGHAIRYDGP